MVLDVARVHSGREVWASWVPGVWSKGGAAVWIDMSCWPYRLFTLQGASGLKKGHWWAEEGSLVGGSKVHDLSEICPILE